MRFLSERIEATVLKIKSDEFRVTARKTEQAYTRNYKLPLPSLILTLLERRGLTLSMEILNFVKKGLVKKFFHRLRIPMQDKN